VGFQAVTHNSVRPGKPVGKLVLLSTETHLLDYVQRNL